jgi:DNA-binding NtrC family response regulator
MKCKIPGTAREIVEDLIASHQYNVKQIAEMLGVTSKTVYRMRKGFLVQPKIHLNLIALYLSLYQPEYAE